MKAETVNLVRLAGVVGAGGAGFPTHVKIASAAEFVIINGAECEPLLRVDQQLMAVEAGKLVRGLEAVMAVTGAATGIIALKEKYKEARKALAEKIEGKPVRLFILGDFFPAGDEQVLVYEVLGRVVPEGGLPIQVGCVVSNVETAINVANALEGIPVTDTYVTVTGAVESPVTLKVPVGTPVAEVLALAGVRDTGRVSVIDGGPMMGKVLENIEQPVTKVTKGLIALPVNHKLLQKKNLSIKDMVRRSKSVCIQCAACSDVCPRQLLGHRLYPHKIMRGLNYITDQNVMKMALICSECGVCEAYGCPMLLSPRQINGAIKKELAAKGIKPERTDPANRPLVSPVREYRKIPSKRLVARLGLSPYDRPAPLDGTGCSPGRVFIPLRQHIGAAAAPVVETGQTVEKGTLIATIPEGALGANIHASITGTVRKIDQNCIEIESDGKRGAK